MLEQHRIPVDYIAGTSMGAYVAALYATGLSADEIEALLITLDFDSGFSDGIPRQELSYRNKQFVDKYPIELKMGFNDGEFTLPRGVLAGQTMSSLIRRSLGPVPSISDFDDLPIPLRTVATDLTDRSEVVFSEGDLVVAMQASMTVPGALAPIEHQGRLLVDGGLVNNLPVAQVQAMGADTVIAVDIGSPLLTQEELGSVFDVIDQLSGYLTNLSRDQQVALLSEQDQLIVPDIEGVGTSDFVQMPMMIERGEAAALRHIAYLEALSLSPQAYQAHLQHKARRRAALLPQQQRLWRVTLNNDSSLSDSVITTAMGLGAGDEIAPDEIEAAVGRIYALNEFERVETQLRQHPEGVELVVDVKHKSWGPNVFDMGIRFEENFEDDLDLGLDLAFTAKDLFSGDLEWRSELNMGSSKEFRTQLYQPMGGHRRYYWRTQYEYRDLKWVVFEQDATNQLRQRSNGILAGLGINLDPHWQIELAYAYEDGNYRSLPDRFSERIGQYQIHGPTLTLGYDSMDRALFPSQGSQWLVQVAHLDSYSQLFEGSLQPGVESTQMLSYLVQWSGATQSGPHNWIGTLEGQGISEDGVHLSRVVSLGGFLNLSGYSKDALFGSHKLLAGGIYRFDLNKVPWGISWPVSLGLSAEAGNVWLTQDEVSLSDLIYAGSLFISADTGWGPTALGYGQASSGENSVYFFFGKAF
ncbi:patatin-like phospholipase family protein [Ferrimonas pelagia]|uniref:Patatin-like phospholipase family protein n=1 Tax=Ferrimonas pelagia TaxID=1177826 RepID=A0ABP9E8J0_9GAMM